MNRGFIKGLLTTCGRLKIILVYFLPMRSRRNPEVGVLIRAVTDDKLPNNASSVSVIGLFRVVFVDANSFRVVEGHANIRPKFTQIEHTASK